MLGIIKIQHQVTKFAAASNQRVTVTFLAAEQAGRPNLGTPSFVLKWFTIEHLKTLSSYVLDPHILTVLQYVHDGGAVYPTSMLECVDITGRKKEGGKRRESELAERPQLVREGSLEDQMLEQSGYSQFGKPPIVRVLMSL